MCARITGRHTSRFAADLGPCAAAVAGRRVLVVGGAGSIGGATVLELAALGPAAIAVVDPNENNLAELLRSVRCAEKPFAGDLSVQPLDAGSPVFRAWLERQPPFDLVWSFAALKHVRSERDPYSLARLLDVNLLLHHRLLGWCRQLGHGRVGVFLVSTDKAADPVSLMGASKRAMERLLWAHADGAFATAPPLPRATTTRFANVLFSDGSLPWSMLQRLEKQQPLAAPADVRRFLVSPRESGHLCLLAALRAPHRHVLVPRLDPQRDAQTFVTVAEAVLAERGLRPHVVRSEADARQPSPAGAWPLLLTTTDTSGEKDMERFVASDERAADIVLASADAVPGGAVDADTIAELLDWIAAIASGRAAPPEKAEITARLGRVVPGLLHRETGRTLDGRM